MRSTSLPGEIRSRIFAAPGQWARAVAVARARRSVRRGARGSGSVRKPRSRIYELGAPPPSRATTRASGEISFQRQYRSPVDGGSRSRARSRTAHHLSWRRSSAARRGIRARALRHRLVAPGRRARRRQPTRTGCACIVGLDENPPIFCGRAGWVEDVIALFARAQGGGARRRVVERFAPMHCIS